MGFPLIRCQKALLATGDQDPNAAMEWLFQHMDDPGESTKPQHALSTRIYQLTQILTRRSNSLVLLDLNKLLNLHQSRLVC